MQVIETVGRLGVRTPAAGVSAAAAREAKADIRATSKINIYFIGVLFVVLMLVTYLPYTALSLVELFYGGLSR